MCAFGVRGAPGRRIGLGAALVALAGLAWTGEPPPLRLVPWPKEIRSQPGTFLLRQPLTLEIGGSAHGAWGA
jgi:hypothetical protein